MAAGSSPSSTCLFGHVAPTLDQPRGKKWIILYFSSQRGCHTPLICVCLLTEVNSEAEFLQELQ